MPRASAVAQVDRDVDIGGDLHRLPVGIVDAHRHRDAIHAHPVERTRQRRRFERDVGQAVREDGRRS